MKAGAGSEDGGGDEAGVGLGGEARAWLKRRPGGAGFEADEEPGEARWKRRPAGGIMAIASLDGVVALTARARRQLCVAREGGVAGLQV